MLVAEPWTLPELVDEVASRIAALPARNGQVRAVPDERTVRYYATLGLLDRPAAMRGRIALYDRRHLAQVVAIKRLQSAGRTLAEIQALWATLDDETLARMSGVALPAKPREARNEFWKTAPVARVVTREPAPPPAAPAAVELRVQLAPEVALAIAVPDGVALTTADIAALRAAAAPLLSELARCRLAPHARGGDQ